MEKKIYREKALKKLSSPEELNEYIKAASNGVWITLAAVLVLLAGVCIWGIFGHISSSVPAVLVSNGSELCCYVTEENAAKINESMNVKVNENSFTISGIGTAPVYLDATESGTIVHLFTNEPGIWVYELQLDGEIATGIYNADIETGSISPISYVIN